MGLRSLCWGGSRELVVALLGVHTTSQNPPPISGMQAYISSFPGSIFSEVNSALWAFSEVRAQK
jgi:hypothetical protein